MRPFVRSRNLHLAARIAFTLAGVTLLLSAATFVLNPWHHFVSLGSQFHVGIWRFRGDTLGRIMFFSVAYHPYRGSLIGLINGDDVVSDFDRRVEWGDSLGVYFRWFHRPDGTTLWTLALSLWYPLAIFIAAGVLCTKFLRRAPWFRLSHKTSASDDVST